MHWLALVDLPRESVFVSSRRLDAKTGHPREAGRGRRSELAFSFCERSSASAGLKVGFSPQRFWLRVHGCWVLLCCGLGGGLGGGVCLGLALAGLSVGFGW